MRRETGDDPALADLAAAAGGFTEGGRWLAYGRHVAPVYPRTKGTPRAGPPFRLPMTIVRMAGGFTALDTLGRFGGILQQYVDVGGSRGISTHLLPFATQSS